jgi:hypothetical protein
MSQNQSSTMGGSQQSGMSQTTTQVTPQVPNQPEIQQAHKHLQKAEKDLEQLAQRQQEIQIQQQRQQQQQQKEWQERKEREEHEIQQRKEREEREIQQRKEREERDKPHTYRSSDTILGNCEVIRSDDQHLSIKFQEVVKTYQDKGMHVVGIDVSERPSSRMFQQCDIPFVMNTRGGEGIFSSLMRSKSMAVIDEDFNKYSRAIEEVFEDLGKRFPGLLKSNWSVEGCECLPEKEKEMHRSTERMIEAVDKLTGQTTGESSIKQVRDSKEAQKMGVPKENLDEHVCQEVELKSKDGTACFKFEQMYLGTKAQAEGVADSVLFLAHKCSMQAKPRTWNLMDVLETELGTRSWKEEGDQQQQQGQQESSKYQSGQQESSKYQGGQQGQQESSMYQGGQQGQQQESSKYEQDSSKSQKESSRMQQEVR